ncbi:conserved hypothetical protein [Paraburkholderia tropica]|uniref:hypothetical protein n=1 Tax=Paraburkholderia tropica TaxID=92647 RepID=UPI001CB1B33D|nr:hypothetical protein [Paraburkholderia tropica]CAG9194521.1 conserved hypothetical protein [Paraburkholderia tropica]
MLDAAQTLNDPALFSAHIAGATSNGTSKKAATLALRRQAAAQETEAVREQERRVAQFPELEKSARKTAARAADELAAAARALRQANALFHVLEYIASAGDACGFDDLTLAEIGKELAGNYAERAQAEAVRFSEGAQ